MDCKQIYSGRRKFEDMFNNFKSLETFNSKTLNLRVLNQNILYMTRQADAILKRVDILINAMNLQNQANEYFEESKSEKFPEKEDLD